MFVALTIKAIWCVAGVGQAAWQCTMWQHAYIAKITKSSFDGLKVDFGSF